MMIQMRMMRQNEDIKLMIRLILLHSMMIAMYVTDILFVLMCGTERGRNSFDIASLHDESDIYITEMFCLSYV